MPIFSFLRPSILGLGSGMGQTDGQTMAVDALCPTLSGRGIISKIQQYLQLGGKSIGCLVLLCPVATCGVNKVGKRVEPL